MSFTDEYLKALEEEKKKKKKNTSQNTQVKKTQSTSTTSKNEDYTSAFLNALDDDIAPVRTTDSEKKYGGGGRKVEDNDVWFKGGAFSDGFDGLSDIKDTFFDTMADGGLGVVKGVGRMAEGLVDLGIYGVGYGADALGFDNFADKAKDAAIYSATDEWTKGLKKEFDDNSLIGNKGDMITEGLGQVATTILTAGVLGAAGVGSNAITAITTGAQGLSTMGTNIGEAYKDGATDGKAFLYGLGTGAIEAATELLSGGLGKSVKALGISRGIGELDDIFAKKLSSKLVKAISNESVQKVLGNTVETAVKSGGEALEEVLSGLGSAFMKWLTYEDDKTLKQLIKDENLLEQAIVGFAVSNFAQGKDFIKANKSKTDYVTGHTANEEKVIETVVEKEIAEREANGKKLTSKEKNKIYDNVVESVQNGSLGIEVIEEALGGENYEAYKKATDENVALKNERDELNKIKTMELTGEQSDRLAELKGMNLDDTTNLDQLGKKWKDDVYNRLSSDRKGQGSLLLESYRERARRGQAFTADLSQYEGKKREAVERAIKSGVLNNTNRSHELVNVLSQIEADKGIIFDYTDNKKLKESGFAIDGKTINGFVKDGAVTLNMQSSKAWESTVGHEITHVLEGTKVYSELQTSLFEYAKSKGEFDTRKADIMKLYEKVENADIDGELTAELVSDYLFNDKSFINHLTGNRTVFQKVWDEVKYLYKVATGKEKASIEKVMKEFDRAWKEMGKATKGSADVKYHISEEFSNDIDMALEGKMEENSQVKARDYTPAILVDNGVNDLPMLITQKHLKSIIYSEAEARALGLKTGNKNHYHGLGKDLLIKAVDSMDNPLEIYKQADDRYLIITEVKNGNGDNVIVPVKIDGKGTYNDVYIDENQILSVYGRKNLENYLSKNNFVRVYKKGTALNPEVQFPDISSSSKVETSTTVTTQDAIDDMQEISTDDSIAPLPGNVNTQFSVSEDSDYQTAVDNNDMETAQKMVDEKAKENGYTVKAYHGTGRADRVGNVFLPERATSGPMAYFTDSKDVASNYAKDKADTSLAYDEEYDSYYTQFRVNRNGKSVSISELWKSLSIAERNNIKERAAHVKFDDDYETIIYDETAQHGNGAWDAYTLNMHKGNALEALVDTWLETGDLYNQEELFLEVLEKVGITDAEYRNPDARYEKVYDTWLKITNPFDTDNANQTFYDSLSEWIENNDMTVYEKETANADMWDKNNQTPESWLRKLESDIEEGKTNAWTVIPDFVTDYLKAQGFDGIKDKGGKGGGAGHTVWIPFSSEQVKSAEPITYDDNGKLIPLSQRFDSSKVDIRNSLSNNGEQPSTKGTPLRDLYLEQDIAPIREDVAKNATATSEAPMLENIPVLPDSELQQGTIAAIRPKPEKQPSLKKVDNAESNAHIAQVLTEEPKVEKKKKSIFSTAVRNFIDKGAVFENLSLKKKNRALQDTYKAMGRSETKAQYFMENGKDGVKPLNSIIEEVEQTGKTQQFYEYLYHKHNIDRMSLESKELPNLERLTAEMNELKLLNLQENQLRAIASEKPTDAKRAKLVNTVREYLASKDVKNKPVFDYSVTAEMSQETARQLEKANPEFKEYAQDVYDYMNYLRRMLVYNGVISPETAELWATMYPNYVPIRRADHNGLAVDVPLDTRKTGINAPIKGATGGNSDILPLFGTMAQRTIQTFKAIDKNRFGVELMNTLGGVVESTKISLDEAIDSIDTHENLLQEGKNGQNPTFTVFEGGERVTFEITDEMYDALKPTSEGLLYTNKVLNTASNLHRGVLTEYNPVFMANNAIKDTQDVLINSQHPLETYANYPEAIKELTTQGQWYTEYMENGGGDNTYFDKQTNTFTEEKSGLRKVIGFPFEKISEANNFIEKVPRLAEYIASRKKGVSIEGAMLDAARVTTDFSAGGDVTKLLNRNGATFLNASVQGFAQQVRNVREAKMNGLKGWVGLATKYALAGLPVLLLNNLLWDDDEEYEELSDYVKDNYYVVAKYGDGKFVRIPKGRTLAVIQNAFEQVSNALTGNDEVDFNRFFDLARSNLAPNNPIDNNIIAPIIQAKTNKTWFDEDLVPTRLQDVPKAEQYDESTDAISKWLGEKINVSPYKINYLLNQYSGGIGDVFLPMMTPKAERGNDSFVGNMIAPLADKFTTDGVMNNKNVSDFYDTSDELKVNANSSYATDEDILKSKYMSSVNAEMGELYKKKREIQNSNLSDAEKYNKVREIQKQINALAKDSLNSYEDVDVQEKYGTVGDRHYRMNKGTWEKITDKQLEEQRKVTKDIDISPTEYWEYKEGLSGLKKNAEKADYVNSLDMEAWQKNYLMNNDILDRKEDVDMTNYDDYADFEEFDYAQKNPEKYAVSKAVGGYDAYIKYSDDLKEIEGEKDANGKTKRGTEKANRRNYIFSLKGLDDGQKAILYRSLYDSADDKAEFDEFIIEYVNGNWDFSYEDRVAIFEALGYTVKDGQVNY